MMPSATENLPDTFTPIKAATLSPRPTTSTEDTLDLLAYYVSSKCLLCGYAHMVEAC